MQPLCMNKGTMVTSVQLPRAKYIDPLFKKVSLFVIPTISTMIHLLIS
jgi:hypothetical protein